MLIDQDVGMDPVVATAVRVVLAWASLIWESKLNRADLRLAVHAAILRQGIARSPWATVNGSAGALVATLDRIGWVVIDESRWQDDPGLVLDLELICPRALAKLAERAVERWTTRQLATKHEELAHLETGITVKPLRRLVRRDGADWGPRHRGLLEALVVGATPCQASLVMWGLAESELCRACEQGPGTQSPTLGV